MEFETMLAHAASWVYWQLKLNRARMVTKNEIDAWLMNRFRLEHADARYISNRISEVNPFRCGNDGVEWTADFVVIEAAVIYPDEVIK